MGARSGVRESAWGTLRRERVGERPLRGDERPAPGGGRHRGRQWALRPAKRERSPSAAFYDVACRRRLRPLELGRRWGRCAGPALLGRRIARLSRHRLQTRLRCSWIRLGPSAEPIGPSLPCRALAPRRGMAPTLEANSSSPSPELRRMSLPRSWPCPAFWGPTTSPMPCASQAAAGEQWVSSGTRIRASLQRQQWCPEHRKTTPSSSTLPVAQFTTCDSHRMGGRIESHQPWWDGADPRCGGDGSTIGSSEEEQLTSVGRVFVITVGHEGVARGRRLGSHWHRHDAP